MSASTLPAAPELPGWTHLSSGKVRDVYTPAAASPSCGETRMNWRDTAT